MNLKLRVRAASASPCLGKCSSLGLPSSVMLNKWMLNVESFTPTHLDVPLKEEYQVLFCCHGENTFAIVAYAIALT